MVGCLTSQQQASVSQGRICSDNFTCCHTEIQVADQTFHLTQSQYIDTGPTSPSADLVTPGAWPGSHLGRQCLSHWYDSTPKKSRRKRDSNPGSSALEADALPLGQRGGRRGVALASVQNSIAPFRKPYVPSRLPAALPMLPLERDGVHSIHAALRELNVDHLLPSLLFPSGDQCCDGPACPCSEKALKPLIKLQAI